MNMSISNSAVGSAEYNVYKLYDTVNNPQYYICKRFIVQEQTMYRNFGSCQHFDEIVSVDLALFAQREIIDEHQAKAVEIKSIYQVLRVVCLLDENGDVDAPMIAKIPIAGFEFCGFDLADNWEISSITNCAGGFEKVFSYKDLNEYGLISDYQAAKRIQINLMEEYPDDEHSYCALFAVWRRI